MVDPTIIAIFLLLLRPVDVLELEGVGEVDGCVGVGGRALEVAVVVEDEIEAVVGMEKVEEEGKWVVVNGGVVVLEMLLVGVLFADVVGLLVVGIDAALDATLPPPSCVLVHNTGFSPSFSTMLKSLLTNMGAFALEVLRSDTSKWHNQASPSSRGTRAEPVAETD